MAGDGLAVVLHAVEDAFDHVSDPCTPPCRDPVFCQVGVGRFGVSFSPCERRVSGRFGVGRSCWLLVIALVIA